MVAVLLFIKLSFMLYSNIELQQVHRVHTSSSSVLNCSSAYFNAISVKSSSIDKEATIV